MLPGRPHTMSKFDGCSSTPCCCTAMAGGVVSGNGDVVKVASTRVAPGATGSWQPPPPVHGPAQPPNRAAGPGVAVSWTAVPTGKLASHVDGQAIPVGWL